MIVYIFSTASVENIASTRSMNVQNKVFSQHDIVLSVRGAAFHSMPLHRIIERTIFSQVFPRMLRLSTILVYTSFLDVQIHFCGDRCNRGR